MINTEERTHFEEALKEFLEEYYGYKWDKKHLEDKMDSIAYALWIVIQIVLDGEDGKHL